MFKKILNWPKKNRLEFFIIILLLAIAAFFRFYNLEGYMTFLGDEGRDALVVKNILVNHDFPLLGPPTSVGNMYNGPLYYYMMSVPMAIFWLNPVATAGMVALLGTISVGLIYFLARSWFGKTEAVVSSILYALSPVVITYSRSSWNPNPAPFFGLLIILSLFKAHQTKKYSWLILTGVALAFIIQMHLLSLIFIPVVGAIWIYELLTIIKSKHLKNSFLIYSALSLVIFLILMSPIVIFDFKYDFMNYKALTTFFFGDRATTVNLNIFNTLGRVLPTYQYNLVERHIAGVSPVIVNLVSLFIMVPIFWGIYKFIKEKQFSWPLFTLAVWLLAGVLGLSLYKQTVYDHYLTFFNPAPYLLIGSIYFLIKKLKSEKLKLIFSGVFVVFVLNLIIINLQNNPLLNDPKNQLTRTKKIAQFVIEKSEDNPFNFALLAEHNYDAAYQYYLDLWGYKPQILPQNKTDQLLVVCEDEVCKPVGHPKYEIAAFGWTKIDEEYEVEGMQFYKLITNPDQEKVENNL